MIGIQEMAEKAKDPLKEIKRYMDTYGFYDAEMVNPYGGLKRSVERELRESIRRTPLKEFLIKSGTTGVAGAAYLVPTKIHDILYSAARPYDIVPLIGKVLTGWEGGAITIDITKDESMRAREYGSGGKLPVDTVETIDSPTITPKAFGMNIPITNSLIEDAQFDLIEWHIEQAAKAMGRKASNLAITVLKAATDGDGTKNTGTSGDADETMFTQGTTTDIVTAIRKLGDDEFVPDTLLCTSEAWGHSIMMHAAAANLNQANVAAGYNNKISILDVLINNSPELHASTDALGATFTNCISVIFDRKNALLTGRKRWLRLEGYADPVDDLTGIVVTGRQDSISIYNDAVYRLTET